MSTKVDRVFGVNKEQILSYVEREKVDKLFLEGLNTDKQIIVYGASKQGKTALVSKYVDYDTNVVVSCSPRSGVLDIYRSILRQLNIEIIESRETSDQIGTEITGITKFKALIPFIGSGEAELSLKGTGQLENRKSFKTIEFNLCLPQDISELIKMIDSSKTIILENFHYLDYEIQKQLAFDLRTFQEYGVRFIILGVWREKNRLVQYNGDLLDRLIEIPVEPWLDEDILRVIEKGEEVLNIKISHEIVNRIIASSFYSIGVIQELLKFTCENHRIVEKQVQTFYLDNLKALDEAILKKADDYATRHIRALEDIAVGNKTTKIRDDRPVPLYLPYYFVASFISLDFNDILIGVKRDQIEREIKKIHHRSNDVRPSDLSNLLHNLTKLQNDKNISPPIFDYDRTQRSLKIIDSTFYFFMKNTDISNISENLIMPELE